MRSCLFVFVLLPALLLLPSGDHAALAHEPTAKSFQRLQAIVLAQARLTSEPAPPPGDSGRSCRLTIDLQLGDPARPTAGLVRVTNLGTGKAVALADQILRDQNWYAVEPRTVLLVPRTKVKVEAFHGIDTGMVTRELDLSAQEAETVSIRLQPFYDPRARGLQAGNTHLHLMKLTHAEMDRYLRLVPQADGLDLVFVSHLRRTPEDRDYITNTLTEGDLGRLSQAGVLFGNGQEHRHNFGPGGEGFGHVMFLNILKLIEPVSIGPGIMKTGTDGIPLARGIRTARQDGATVIWCHNTFGHEDIPSWASGLVHAQNIFDGGDHGTYEDTFYRYLNIGLQVPFSTGTDWFIYDFSRVYVPVTGVLTGREWLAQLAAGRSYITNGVFLEFTANGQPIGDTLDLAAGDGLKISGQAVGRNNFGKLELIHNGRPIHAVAATAQNDHFAADLTFTLRVDEPGWVALRIPKDAGQNEFARPLFAHTSPIYVMIGGRRIFQPEVARGLTAEMRASQSFVEANAKFGSDLERESVLRVYREAIANLQARIEQGQ